MGNFQPLEIVDRDSDAQSQVVENLNKLTQQDKGERWITASCRHFLASPERACRNHV